MRCVFDTMGTVASVEASGLDERTGLAVEHAMAAWDATFSLYRPDSELSRIAAGTLDLADSTERVRDTYALALSWSGRTDGAFTPHRPDGVLDLDGVVKALAIAEAGEILAAAGFNSSAPLKFTYRYINVPDIKKAAVALQAMWRAVGIQVELQASEAKVHWNLLEVHDFEAAHNSWSLDYNDAKNLFFTFQIAAEQLNSSWYASEIFENFLREADHEPDSAKRARLLGNAHAQLIADIPSVPLMFPYQRHLVKSYVVNWVSNPRAVNRTRWLDLGDKSASPALPDVNAEQQDGFFDWVASWFSPDAWSKWWNN